MTFTQYLNQIIRGHDLTQDQAAEMITHIFSGTITPAQTGAFMAALATKGECFEELAGGALAMRRKALRVQTLDQTVIDIVGTGGDGTGTFNISTTASFVVAGAGITVAKHGNRSVSSKCGSADVLEALGVNLAADPEIIEEAINEIGIGFMFAPLYHGSMKHAMTARKECGIRSIFNMLGPLTNPAAASCQVVGVYAPALTEMFANALHLLGVRRAFVVHGHDGMDEITTTDLTRVSELCDGRIKSYDLDPLTYFDDYADPETLQGGDAKENAAILTRILSGEKGAPRDIVLINAGAGLVAANAAADIRQGIQMAADSIDSGRAMKKLEALVQYTRENA
ncbi:anthranilate phosphoribosyltransferase [Desulfotignum phosphitoxidans]|jgi:anthranilate phosphoribosyltransferase|uniref:Anthranilate phosphoribosyltransferase n=1 Tax=Desulfotignum phosphitoxidans DSM 13687 TaxID=1286635 RepID=S0G730_9BACT|nr:anthranilate phosphoribosyltransferase [Desulfotignum phosphitoxidans]EMS80531.1 anthranilate phosphoribosyltransferase TrpD [Desulfotignum phosphitoxidans DSM 13687]